MRTFPAIGEHSEWDALVIRTDYEDEQAWQVVTAALLVPPTDGTADVHFVDDPAWAGASVDEVLAAVSGDEGLSIVFLADKTTMQADHHALLAVTTVTREDLDNDEDYEAMTEFGREFRSVPVGIHGIHVNLELANMDFEEFAEEAQNDPEGVFRGYN